MSADNAPQRSPIHLNLLSENTPRHGVSVVEKEGHFLLGEIRDLDHPGLHPEELANLALKIAFMVPTFTTSWIAERMCLAHGVTGDLLAKMRTDKLIENLGEVGHLDYRFCITDSGRERARRLFEISGYVGPAPVSLEAYQAVLEYQLATLPKLDPRTVMDALEPLVLPRTVKEVAGFAGSSGRSLFIYGPPGNGKTTLGHLLHDALAGEMWVPYAISLENTVVRVFDPRIHEEVPLPTIDGESPAHDRRWIRVRRPFVVASGEMTLESLDLGYTSEHGYYEMPLHIKANGGIFLLDDLGFQRSSPKELLSRWIFPLERHIDYLTLNTGQKITVPFRQMLIVSTNMDPEKVMSPAFLRRMGYRLYLGNPNAEDYATILREYAARWNTSIEDASLEHLLQRYENEGRPMRACEPRDLIERARDICKFRSTDLALTPEILDLAWTSYFGNAVV